jgi:hypothetical protein
MMKEPLNKETYDHLEVYCRKLGHTLPFKYCRIESNGLPCSKIMDCWFQRFPIQEYIQNNYSREEITRICSPSKSKMDYIHDLMNRDNSKSS